MIRNIKIHSFSYLRNSQCYRTWYIYLPLSFNVNVLLILTSERE
jgi:hypothetical protein